MTSYNQNLEAPRQLSLIVYEFLDQLGLSDEIRKLHREYAYTSEITKNIEHLGDSNRFNIFGSTIEGTQTPGMNSDFDFAVASPAAVVNLVLL